MVRIVADSTCDLPEDIVRDYAVTIVPLHIVLGDTEYRDRVEITPDEIFDWCETNKTTPKTSAASFEDIETALEPIVKSGDEAIAFVISESMSTTGNVFRMVIEDLEAEGRIHVFDSQNLSVGIGLLMVEACEMAKEGLTAAEILRELSLIREKVRASFVVDDLNYLARGGRCSGITALAGGMLKLHPKIFVKDGVMEEGRKYRGAMKNVVMDYAHDLEEELACAQKDRVFLISARCDDAVVEEVKDYLESLNHFDSIIVTCAGGVISSHCGPGTLGIMYIAG